MEEPEDVDMTASITLPAQNHDRQDDAMEDGGHVTIAHDEHASTGNLGNTQTVNQNESADAMDTTPDGSPLPVHDIPEPPPAEAHVEAPQSDSPATLQNDPVELTGDGNGQLVAPADIVPTESTDTAVVVEETQPPGADPTSPPPPPPGPEAIHPNDETSSISSEEGAHQWREMVEDTSAPDEQEMKEIEGTTEHSAHEGESWSVL